MVDDPPQVGGRQPKAPRSEAQALARRIHAARIAVLSDDLRLRSETRAILIRGGFTRVRVGMDLSAASDVEWSDLDVLVVDLALGRELKHIGEAVQDLTAERGAPPLVLGIEPLSGSDPNALPSVEERFDAPLDPRALIFSLRSRLLLRDVLGEAGWVGVQASGADAREKDVLRRIAKAAEWRIDRSGMHVDRVAALSTLVARALGMSRDRLDGIGDAAALHDLGTLVVPDEVLLKTEALDAEEFALMRSHTWVGASILQGLENDLTDLAAQIAWCHHERWDGAGYPRGLSGVEIPLEARIVAAVDLFDALLHGGADPPASELAVTMLVGESGKAFDPTVVNALVRLWDTGSASFLYGVDPGREAH